MNKNFGGKQQKLRDTKIKELGPYQHTLQIGDTQSMSFDKESRGPFYLPNAEKRKHDQHTGKHKILEKTKKQLLSDLKQKGVKISRHYTKEELHHLASANKVALTFVEPVVIPGWCGKPKGLLQVLWERGWINVAEIDRYSVDGKDEYKDENGQVKKEYERYL